MQARDVRGEYNSPPPPLQSAVRDNNISRTARPASLLWIRGPTNPPGIPLQLQGEGSESQGLCFKSGYGLAHVARGESYCFA